MAPTTHLLILTLALTLQIASPTSQWAQTQSSPPPIPPQTLTKLHFYFHDVERGPQKTVAIIAKPENSSVFDFGTLAMIDNPLTTGLDRHSGIVGRAQGMYGVASGSRTSLVMNMVMHFFEGRFNGSSISVLGWYNVGDVKREMAIVGGTGVFRFASGFVKVKKTRFSGVGDENTAEFNVFVLHSGV